MNPIHTKKHFMLVADFCSASVIPKNHKTIGSTQFRGQGHTYTYMYAYIPISMCVHTDMFNPLTYIHKSWHKKNIARNVRVSKCNVILKSKTSYRCTPDD